MFVGQMLGHIHVTLLANMLQHLRRHAYVKQGLKRLSDVASLKIESV